MKKRYILNRIFISGALASFFMISPDVLHAQLTEFEPIFYHQQSLSIQKTGMIVLTSWASLNILSGFIGNYHYSNDAKYFFQMNGAWNIVNLGIATYGLASIAHTAFDMESSLMLSEMQKFDRILLINAGLDLIYIATGSYLLNKGLSENKSRFVGYGRSLILQGGFLLLFDLILYFSHYPYTKSLFQITEQINFTTAGISISF